MKYFSRILVPTDLSEFSRHGIDYSSGLAEEQRAELIILHVAKELGAWETFLEEYGTAPLSSSRLQTDEIVSEAMLDLDRFLEPYLKQFRPLPLVKKRIVLGHVVQEIVRVAQDERADLVILARRRQRGLRHCLIGNVAERVTRISPCPVLVVAPPHASLAWGGTVPVGEFRACALTLAHR